jgi:elongation factor P hydroxylase
MWQSVSCFEQFAYWYKVINKTKMQEQKLTTYNVWMQKLYWICCNGAAGILNMKFHIAEFAKML